MPEHDQHPADSASVLPVAGDAASTGSHPVVPSSGGRRRARRRASGCLPVLLILAVVAGLGYLAVTRGLDALDSAFGDPDDYPGPGQGQVTFEVEQGDSISTVGSNLVEAGVVASTEAYVAAAEADPEASSIQPGVYRLQRELPAADAVDLLAGGTTRGVSFTFTAGKTVDEIVALLAQDTDVTRAQYRAALQRPASIGLPAAADGDAEGYLAPGSYTFFADDDATAILSAMVEASTAATENVGLAAAAERLGYSEHDLLTVASLVQAEGSLLDEQGKAQIARVIYNRLADSTNETVGRLQIDATIDFIYGDKVARRTTAEIDAVADNPYNTYRQAGLPPGPIATPSADALQATVEPAQGDWLYYVTVNLRTGETKFAETFDEFQQYEAELDEYCDTQSDRC